MNKQGDEWRSVRGTSHMAPAGHFQQDLSAELSHEVPPQQLLLSTGELGGCGNQAMWEQNSCRLSGCWGLSRCLGGAESGQAALTAPREGGGMAALPKGRLQL